MTGIDLRTCIPIPKVPEVGRPRFCARTRIGEATCLPRQGFVMLTVKLAVGLEYTT